MTEELTSIRPARGTRPANRRQLIVDAASELFYRRGYSNVAMSDVAEAVAIGPSALYRHFPGKEALLATVVGDGLARIAEVLSAAEHDQSLDVATELAATVLRHRAVGVLWYRESRQLTAEHRTQFLSTGQKIVDDFARVIAARRPDLRAPDAAELLSWCTIAVANSVSFHSLDLPESDFIKELSDLISTAMNTPIEPFPAAAPPERVQALTPQSRREAILAAATRLFALNGFSGVSVDDIGADIGIAGPSVYNHFPSKADILAAAVFRGEEWLRMEMNQVFAQAKGPLDGMQRLLASYVKFGLENPHLIQILVSEGMHLPAADAERSKTVQLAYIGEWVHLVRQIHPSWDPIRTRLRVQAAQSMVNDVALVPRARRHPAAASVLNTVGGRLLAVSD